MKDVIQLAFIARCVALRKGLKLTQQDVADELGLSRPAYANIEANRQNINLITAFKLGLCVGLFSEQDAFSFISVEDVLKSCPACLGDGVLLTPSTKAEVRCYGCKGIGMVSS